MNNTFLCLTTTLLKFDGNTQKLKITQKQCGKLKKNKIIYSLTLSK